MPGSASSAARVSARSALRSSRTVPRPGRCGQRDQRPAAGPRHPQRSSGSISASRAGVGNRRVTVCVARRGRAARRGPATSRAVAVRADGQAHLLTQDGLHRRSRRRRAAPAPAGRGRPRPAGASTRVLGQRLVDGDRVAVGVEQPAGALERRGEVAGVGQRERARHHARAAGRPGRRAPRPGRAAAGATRSYHPGPTASSPGTACTARKWCRSVGSERLAHGDPGADGPRRGCRTPSRAPGAQLGRRGGVHLADGVVELADAGEPRREGDVGEGEVGGLDQHPGGLGPAGAGQGERAGAVLLGDHAG